ncbi:UvrD-helicase domain-containing protein [Verrucomicrobiota bacterium]
MAAITHKAILASAGSGKTFQLAHRYIRLLADKGRDVITPDRICAMTFTRKASGEIFDSIAEYLQEAASDPHAARVTAVERINMPGLKQKDFLLLLKRFVNDLHRARIGTFDSFIIKIAKAFPLELGIPINFSVTDSDSSQAGENRQAVLDQILDPAGPKDLGKNFINAFKNATFGREEKTFGKVLDNLLNEMRVYFRLCPDQDKWGNENLVWPGKGRPWKGRMDFEGIPSAQAVIEWTNEQPARNANDRNFFSSLERIAGILAVYGPRSAWDPEFDKAVFPRLLDAFRGMKKGPVDIPYGRKDSFYSIPAEIGAHLYQLIHNLLVIEYDRILRRTIGLYDLLNTYENKYDDVTRASGIFSFTDIQYLLAGEPAISRQRNLSSADRLYIDFRMDCRLDHWLLDEFQDTSDLQWEVFENLISEIVQAPANENRSFFYVGDVKQAIYRWRGGNHELFLDIIDKFNQHDTVIHMEPMLQTRRCSQPVTNALNTVFSSLPDNLPARAIEKWNKVWKPHETAVENKELGYVALMQPEHTPSGVEPEEARYGLVADLLNEIQPVRRGLEVGVLMRKNDSGRKLVNVLRRQCREMSVVHEGVAAVTENEVAQVLLALVKLAGHPGDEFAWKYIRMSPMAQVLEKRKIGRNNISPKLLAETQENGFQSFVHNWGTQLARVKDLQDFGRESLDRLETAAAQFDMTGSRKVNGFLRFMERYTISEQPSSNAVRVMTVHQAKGLEFDIVILPELQDRGGSNMVKDSKTELLCAGKKSDPDWILRMPRKIIAEHDKRLKEQLDNADAEHCFDSLCLLYVAMTRAKRGLYMITSPTGKTSDALYPSVFLKRQLVQEQNAEQAGPAENSAYLFESGPDCPGGQGRRWYEKDWPEKEPERLAPVIRPLPRGYAKQCKRRPVLHHREPSRQKDMTVNAARLFGAESTDIINFGKAIHELMAQIVWIEDADIEKIIKDWEPFSQYDKQVTKDVITQFRTCLQSETVRKSLSRENSPSFSCASLWPDSPNPWIEKRFDIVLNNELVSGTFDRVTIIRDAKGKPLSAVILDFKSSVVDTSSKIDEKVKDYTPQMTTYRQALSRILGLPQANIQLSLLLTRQALIRNI